MIPGIVASQGAAAIQGALSATLAAATLAATAGAPTGTLAATLANATLSAAGSIPLVGSLSRTLASASLVTAGSGNAAVFDGLSPTGAWSFSRDLLSTWGGAARYTEVSAKISVLKDQSGAARDLSQATAAARPVIGTAGPNGITCGVFNSTDNTKLDSASGDPLSDFIAAGAGYMIVSFLADTIDANNATVYLNEGVISDTLQIVGLFTKTGPNLHAYNWDGSVDSVSAAIATGAVKVAEWRHEGGTLYLRINGAGEVSVASGNTTTLTGLLRIGGNGVGASGGAFDGKIFEAGTFATVPDASTRDAIVANFMAHAGAS